MTINVQLPWHVVLAVLLAISPAQLMDGLEGRERDPFKQGKTPIPAELESG